MGLGRRNFMHKKKLLEEKDEFVKQQHTEFEEIKKNIHASHERNLYENTQKLKKEQEEIVKYHEKKLIEVKNTCLEHEAELKKKKLEWEEALKSEADIWAQ